MKYKYLASIIYLLGIFIGFIYLNSLTNIISNSNNLLSSLDYDFSFAKVLSTNLKVVFINILGGLTFGIMTYINLIYNGIMLSYILKAIYIMDFKYYLVILPHSFEIIGFIIAGAVGIELGIFLFNFIFLDREIKINKIRILNKIALSILIIFISALIEVYVSPYVI